jgi:hypothetical protein
MAYIKSVDEFNEYLKSANEKFRKVYFLFSPQSGQFSYQDDLISYFTESILKAVATHGEGEIRYKDLIDYVSDDFRGSDSQKPFF